MFLLSDVAKMANISKSTLYRYCMRGILKKGSFQRNVVNGRIWFTPPQALRVKQFVQEQGFGKTAKLLEGRGRNDSKQEESRQGK